MKSCVLGSLLLSKTCQCFHCELILIGLQLACQLVYGEKLQFWEKYISRYKTAEVFADLLEAGHRP